MDVQPVVMLVIEAGKQRNNYPCEKSAKNNSFLIPAFKVYPVKEYFILVHSKVYGLIKINYHQQCVSGSQKL